MLDLFLPVWYTRNNDGYHADPECPTLGRASSRATPRKPRRTRLGSMLAAHRDACTVCAGHLAIPASEAQRLLAAILPQAVPA